jgi:hypothetical protein
MSQDKRIKIKIEENQFMVLLSPLFFSCLLIPDSYLDPLSFKSKNIKHIPIANVVNFKFDHHGTTV